MFKILSLDGGGIRGIISAYWLDKLKSKLQSPLYEYFDLITGTSTGSILASAIALDTPLEENSFVDFYKKHGANIFNPHSSLASFSWMLPSVLKPKYDSDILKEILKNVFSSGVTMSHCKKKLIIPTYDVFSRQPVWLRSYDQNKDQTPIWEACAASSAAPVYFSAHVIKSGHAEQYMIDGGVVANNPSACALAEAIKIMEKSNFRETEDILLISLGTGNLVRPISKDDALNWGAIHWARPLLDVLFDGSSCSVNFICKQILSNDMYYRMQVELRGANDDLDDASDENLQSLVNIADSYISAGDGLEKFEKIVSILEKNK